MAGMAGAGEMGGACCAREPGSASPGLPPCWLHAGLCGNGWRAEVLVAAGPRPAFCVLCRGAGFVQRALQAVRACMERRGLVSGKSRVVVIARFTSLTIVYEYFVPCCR